MLFLILGALVLLFWLCPQARAALSPGPELVGRAIALGVVLWVIGAALQVFTYGAVTTPYGP